MQIELPVIPERFKWLAVALLELEPPAELPVKPERPAPVEPFITPERVDLLLELELPVELPAIPELLVELVQREQGLTYTICHQS